MATQTVALEADKLYNHKNGTVVLLQDLPPDRFGWHVAIAQDSKVWEKGEYCFVLASDLTPPPFLTEPLVINEYRSGNSPLRWWNLKHGSTTGRVITIHPDGTWVGES